MQVSKSRPKRVFISYSHESDAHNAWVLGLAGRLRGNGIDAWLDRYVISPTEGWPRWMQRQIEESDFTILVCTQTYKRRFEGREVQGFGSGVTWEGLIANQILYDSASRNRGFIAVLPQGGDPSSIPIALRGFTYYLLDDDYEALYRHIMNQPEIVPPPLPSTVLGPSPTDRTALERRPILSDGIPDEKPVLPGLKIEGPGGDKCFSMELLSPLNCEVAHSGVICTKYGREASVWTVRVMDEQSLLNEDGEVRQLQPFVILVESKTKEAISLVANTDLWLRDAVPTGTELKANERIGTLLIPKDNVRHPPFTVSRGVTYEGILKYRPRITDRFWRAIGSEGKRDKYEITEHRAEQDSGVVYLTAPAAGIFEPATNFHYTPGRLIRRNERIGFIIHGRFPREIRSNRNGTLLSTMVGVKEAVHAGQPLFSVRTDPPTLDISMMPSQTDTPYWYDLFSPLNGSFTLGYSKADGSLVSSGLKFQRATPLCSIDAGDIVMRIALDIEGSIMQIFPLSGETVSFGELLMSVRAESVLIRAPIVGNFYCAPAAGETPFVAVGTKVRVGDVLCIIEALKLNNEITSELPGVIAEILGENGNSLEYNQPLFVIKPQ